MVIQRWQNLMLLISTVLAILFLTLTPIGIPMIAVVPLYFVAFLSGGFSLFALISFKHLNLQSKLVQLSILFAVTTLVVAALLYLWTTFIWFVPAFLLDIWAYFRIKADQNLLKSYDRLR